MILRLDPTLVGDYKNAPAVEPISSFAPAALVLITKDRSAHVHIGFPHLATAEKGETLFQIFADDVTHFLERVVNWDGSSWGG